jgi:hypothetical protein
MKANINLYAALISVWLMFPAVAATGQTLNADEMILTTSCLSKACFHDFVTTKGFFAQESQPIVDDADVYVYASHKYIQDPNKANNEVRNICLIIISKDHKAINVGFRTIDETYFKGLLNEFKTKGYEYIDKAEISNGTLYNYRSVKYPNINLQVRIDVNSNNGISWIAYDFELVKLRMEKFK